MTALPIQVGASPRGRALRVVATVVAFELAWFACVLGAARGWPSAGTAVALGVIVGFIACSDKPRVDAALVAVALVVGLAWDSALLQLGWIAYAAPGPVPGLAPAWILALWALFAVTLRAPMRALHRRLALAAVLGAIGGPLSYAAAQRLGAVGLLRPEAALVALALAWAVITPLLLALARRWDAR